MPKFEVHFVKFSTVEIEADDQEEAEDIVARMKTSELDKHQGDWDFDDISELDED